jgi:hypothetical protein
MLSGRVVRANVKVNGEPTKTATAPVTQRSHVEIVAVRPVLRPSIAWLRATAVATHPSRVDHVRMVGIGSFDVVTAIALHSVGYSPRRAPTSRESPSDHATMAI